MQTSYHKESCRSGKLPNHSQQNLHSQTNSNPPNIDIFLSNLPYPHKVVTIDALSSNHLPVKLTIEIDTSIKRSAKAKYTNWKAYKQICNTYPINTELNTFHKIDAQIAQLQKSILNAFQKSTYIRGPTRKLPNADPYLQDLIRRRNKHRRKFQKTRNPIHNLLRNILTIQIQKRIKDIRNAEWQTKLSQIKIADHIRWRTYRIIGGSKTKIPALIDFQTGQAY